MGRWDTHTEQDKIASNERRVAKQREKRHALAAAEHPKPPKEKKAQT